MLESQRKLGGGSWMKSLDEVLASFVDGLDNTEACYGDPRQQPNPYDPQVWDEYGLRTFLEPCYALIKRWIGKTFGVDLQLESHRAHAPCYPDVTGVIGSKIFPGEVRLKRQYTRPEGASDQWLMDCFFTERHKVCKIVDTTYGYMLACNAAFAFVTTYEETWLMTTLLPETLPVPNLCDGRISVDSNHKTLWVSRSFGRDELLRALAVVSALFTQVESPYLKGRVEGLPWSQGYDIEVDLPGSDGSRGEGEGSSGEKYFPRKEMTSRRAGEGERKLIIGTEISATERAICYRGIIFDKQVVVKIMDRVKNGKADQLLRGEIQAYLALEDVQGICVPNLIAWGTIHGGICGFLATSYAGRSLGQLFAKEHKHEPNWELVKSMKKEALSILWKIHENGLVHGDLHSENILVAGDGSLLFCDLQACAHPPKGAEELMMKQERRTLDMIFVDLFGSSGTKKSRWKGAKDSFDEERKKKEKRRSQSKGAEESSYEDKKKKRRSRR